MSTPSEQWIVNTLRQATENIPVPPEARWIREHHARRPAFMMLIAATLFVAVVAMTVSSLTERVVPATTNFLAADDAAWQQVRAALPSDVVVLRPTYLPSQFKTIGTKDCPSPFATWSIANRSYDVIYLSGTVVSPQTKPENRSCVRLEFSIARANETVSAGLSDAGTIAGRGTSILVRYGADFIDRISGARHHLVYLNWTENETAYEISTFDLSTQELSSIIAGLEAVQLPFTGLEDAAWTRVHSTLVADIVVLRPAWLPSGIGAAPECGAATSAQVGPGRYDVSYSERLPSGACDRLLLRGRSGSRDSIGPPDIGCYDAGTVTARQRLISVRTCASHGLGSDPPATILVWNESSATYDVRASVPIADLIRIVESLAPVR
jgi:hypothetical protein